MEGSSRLFGAKFRDSSAWLGLVIMMMTMMMMKISIACKVSFLSFFFFFFLSFQCFSLGGYPGMDTCGDRIRCTALLNGMDT